MRKTVEITVSLSIPVEGNIRNEHKEVGDKALNYLEECFGYGQNVDHTIEITDLNIDYIG